MKEIADILTHPMVRPIALALAAGTLAYFLSRWSPWLCKCLALIAGAGALAGGIDLWQMGDGQVSWTWGKELVAGVALRADLATAPLGLIVVIGSAAFALLITVYSLRAMKGQRWEGKFYAYLIWALGGACIVGLADNLLVLLIGWEITTLMLFLMTNQGRHDGDRDARAGAAKAYGMLGFADACLLLAIALLVGAGGSDALLMGSPARAISGVGAALGAEWMGYLVYVLIMIAALAKAGAIPLHTWIPAMSQDAPTPVMAYLPAAVDKLLGIYLLAVLSLRMFRPDPAMQVVMMVIGGVTILAAVLMAMMQHNLKKLLSFHAVSQVGYMVLGIGTGTTIGVIGGLFHMVNHAIYKSNLFLMSGTVTRAAGSDELEDMGGLARYLPVTFICGLIAAAAISGVPPFNGFVSKWLVYQGTLQVTSHGLGITLVVVAVFGSALTLASFVKVMYSAFLSPAPRPVDRSKPKPRESFFLAAPMVVLAVLCVVLGLFPYTMINSVLAPALGEAALTGEPLAAAASGVTTGSLGLWSPAQATGLLVIGLLLGSLFVWVSSRKTRMRVVRPFLAGEVAAPNDDRFRVPGTHFYETIAKLPVIGPLLAHGQDGAMDPYHWSGKHGNTFVQLLRAQHTGLLSLYAAWCVLGVIASLVYLLLTTGRPGAP